MKKIFVIAAASVLAIALIYFSPLNRMMKEAVPAEEVVIEDVAAVQEPAKADTSVLPQSTAAPSQVVTGITQPAGSSVTSLDDGSSITTVEDGRGNRVESRFINGDRQVKGIIVNTSVDGSKQVRIMLADGSSRVMTSEPVGNVIRATPSQIATALGVFGDLTVRSTPTPVTEPSPGATPSSSN